MTLLSIKGWKRESGDVYFQRRRLEADTADTKRRWGFFGMMKGIGFEMNNVTGALSLGGNDGSSIEVLDLCIAPGGYSAVVLNLNPTASIDAISLSHKDGGHGVLIPFGRYDPRVQILFTDITLLAAEYGVDMGNIPSDHPDAANFNSLRPYEGKQYGLVLCDGQVLRTHRREAYREGGEPTRLTNAQLILGLQRIKPGGTLIILLHKLETWDTVMLVRSFSAFATIELFKPTRAHAIKSSFYLIAKNVQPQSMEAKFALKRYRRLWHNATFVKDIETGGDDITEDVTAVLEEFGPKLVEVGREIWRVQAEALEKAPFMQGTMNGGEALEHAVA